MTNKVDYHSRLPRPRRNQEAASSREASRKILINYRRLQNVDKSYGQILMSVDVAPGRGNGEGGLTYG